MKRAFLMVALFLGMCLTSGVFAQTAKLSMGKAKWEAYKQARLEKNWALCEQLTVFPDVKAWDANNAGYEAFKAGRYQEAHEDFVRALKYAKEADAIGRSRGMDKLRRMIFRDEKTIRGEK